MSKTFSAIVSLLLLSVFATAESKENTWSFDVEGMPAVSGSVMTKMGFGSNMKYSLASSAATISISTRGENAPVSLMIKYKETKMQCMSHAETISTLDSRRIDFSGKLRCFAAGAKPDEFENSEIAGWVDLK